MDLDAIAALIRDIPDFPEPGIQFKDITPILGDPKAFRATLDLLGETIADTDAEAVVGIEARGFVVAAPVASLLGLGFVPVRKQGKLPFRTRSTNYALEYGYATIEIHEDAFPAGAKVAVLDDVLATGGTAEATCKLIEELGAEVVAVSFLIELEALGGRSKLEGRPVSALLTL